MATVSLLLRVGILMRSVNERWQRHECAVEEKQAPCPYRTAAAAHSLFHLTPRFTRKARSPYSFLSQIFFSFVSHVHLLVMCFSSLATDMGDLDLRFFDSNPVFQSASSSHRLLMLSSGVPIQWCRIQLVPAVEQQLGR